MTKNKDKFKTHKEAKEQPEEGIFIVHVLLIKKNGTNDKNIQGGKKERVQEKN